MLGKIKLYFNTCKKMKPSQICYRLAKNAGIKCTLGCTPQERISQVNSVDTPEELDYDREFLERFHADEFMEDKITFLHSCEAFDWTSEWKLPHKSTLWNFNLHYFEYLLSMIKAYRNSGDRKYLDKTILCIDSWIVKNPKGKGTGWSPYPIDLRLTNWIGYYSAVGSELPDEFRSRLINSMHEQYCYLSEHLEKDILGNHYFEDLKTLVLCSLFFCDEKMLDASLSAFIAECREEILPDGMHFELSPMYHKIVFEGLLRVAVALRGAGKRCQAVEEYIQPMLDAAWSLEEGLDRVPLFNDGGNNVAKSLDALMNLCKREFGITPQFKGQFRDSGFYIFKWGVWKMVIDAGQPGPDYIPGHVHCDAMSFELFQNGKPVIVNCGTYAYQCRERDVFRSTRAHNTVMVNGTEQSQCWGSFRMAKRSSVTVLEASETSLVAEMRDWKGQQVRREIVITPEQIRISDTTKDGRLKSFFHFTEAVFTGTLRCGVKDGREQFEMPYAVDYGHKDNVPTLSFEQDKEITVAIQLESALWGEK